MKLHHITIKGDGPLNEDALIFNEGQSLFGVADGVSSLVPFTSKEHLTGGYIASQTVKDALESIESGDQSLYEALTRTNERLHMKMTDYQIDGNRKEHLWGTALATVRVGDSGIEFIQTGDCMILAVYESGEVRPLTRLQVEHLEETAIEMWRECIRRGFRKKDEIMPHVKEQLIANRQLSNAEGGYGVLNGEPEAVKYFEYGKINKVGLSHLILLTDGLFLPAESIPEGEPYWEFTACSILEKGIEKYAADLIDLEESDPECITYPRFKKSDDKAGIVMDFGGGS
ncbi:protein phosphatase 2C domain-containing protein [Rossellomorea sp. DA94]|uniref:protein phosphatase 2C domain-containing protein n=1 Tax=Rossellomorea sp. DA94 TaxID=3038653 RepID=UPI00244858A3|nr:protein phosphatase 2C domain-containing protein [Rossellomorea sp. DA94]WGG46375.1 protein phosphatase 2C domain-containing protein [Rossellomorea sp. DA94]